MLFVGKQIIVRCNRAEEQLCPVTLSHFFAEIAFGAGSKTRKPRPFPAALETQPTHQPFVKRTKLTGKEKGKYVLFKHLHGGFAEIGCYK